jgi:calcineurin-like phosphoesterase family protein
MSGRSIRALGLAMTFVFAVPTTALATDPTSAARAIGPQATYPALVGAGDIADCGRTADSATAALIARIPGHVYTLGDNVYPNGTAQQFAACYQPTWGRFKLRTRPATGNHDYHTAGAAGYFGYFGRQAGRASRGYYAYNLGTWRIYVLNSNCEIVSCAAGSAQERWLRADLAANRRSCVLAYWHHPLFSSGQHGGDPAVQPLWAALYGARAEIVLNGHDHNYERFARQSPSGTPTARGIRQFVVGTGGAGLRPFGPPTRNSVARNSTTHGVLKLTLNPRSFHWRFVPVAGRTYTDAGWEPCH